MNLVHANGILAAALFFGGCDGPVVGNKSYGGMVAIGPKGVAGLVYQREFSQGGAETESIGAFLSSNGEGGLNTGTYESNYFTPFCDQVHNLPSEVSRQYGSCRERWR